MYIKQFKKIINNKKYVFRLLNHKDEKILADFFLNLSEDIKIKYSPHPFDKKTAKEICEMKDKKFKRVICIHNKTIVAYCIIYFKLRIWEKMRYNKAGIFIEDEEVSTIAPCVLDEYQHTGIGSIMFDYVLKVSKVYNKKIIVLWGGVVLKNHQAINYYKKMNMKILKKWFHPLAKVMCYDMYIDIR